MIENSWQEIRPSRFKVAQVYTKRMALRNFNSEPYLSGDLFADHSDYNYHPISFRYNRSWYKSLKNAKVIFCPSSDLYQFLEEFHSKISAKVIIAGNGDHEFHEPPRLVPKSLKHIFLQNSFISDNSRFSTLPIGIENIRYGVNGLPRNLNSGNQLKNGKILFGPFGLTHQERVRALKNIEKSSLPIDIISGRVDPKPFAELMSQYSFVAAVRGNGVDTHRLWESLYRGCTPLIKKDLWAESLFGYKLPIEIVEDWDEASLSQALERAPKNFDPTKIPSLWWPYWKASINAYT